MISRYVAFMRAINVRGHAQIRMTDVRDIFSDAGGANVVTVIQTGNVLFECAGRAAMTAVIAKASTDVRALTGVEPLFIVRTMAELTRIRDASPFGRLPSDRAVKLYVAFLARAPRRAVALERLTSPSERLETLAVRGREAYIVSRRKPSGMYGFPNNFIEAALGVPATTRNWSTVNRIAMGYPLLP